jgi:enoyl-CoA hydratase/carnithine racemase
VANAVRQCDEGAHGVSLAELHAAARDRGIERYRRLSRAELEAALGDGAETAPDDGPPVRLERDGPLALIVLDDPATRNAIGSAAMDALEAILAELEAATDVTLVALTGAGRTFSSGAAIREFDPMDGGGEQLTDRGSAILDRLAALPVPTVALVNGHAVGGGAEVALACDWRIIAPDAELRFVHASIGLVPGLGGLQRLRRLVGESTALRLLATCESVKGGRAVELGLAAEVVPSETQRSRAWKLAQRVADADRGAIAAAKAALAAGTRAAERDAFLACWPNRRIPRNALG